MSGLIYAISAAFLAGIAPILAKVGMKKNDAALVMALRTIVIFVFAVIITKANGVSFSIDLIDEKSFLFLLLTAVATGVSWLCYFHALKIGEVNHVTVVDKSTTSLTMLLAFLILKDTLGTNQIVSMGIIFVGVVLIVLGDAGAKNKKWLIYACGSVLFASLSSILSRVGVHGVHPNLVIVTQLAVILVLAWIVVFATNGAKHIRSMSFVDGILVCLSGIAMGFSWICYFHAVAYGQIDIAVLLERLSFLITVICACVFLKEHLSAKSIIGLILLAIGTCILL